MSGWELVVVGFRKAIPGFMQRVQQHQVCLLLVPQVCSNPSCGLTGGHSLSFAETVVTLPGYAFATWNGTSCPDSAPHLQQSAQSPSEGFMLTALGSKWDAGQCTYIKSCRTVMLF